MIGIDSQVQARMDQFRGRPQDLMQQYQMGRELIDLLALQKLKSEKDAAARSMMMQMQQNPQTIAAQREAELMGRTQQEVAQQVGGIAQLAEARKQQNLQRMASGAQPPVRMAQGGIARFAGPDGSYVEPQEPTRAEELWRALSGGVSGIRDLLTGRFAFEKGREVGTEVRERVGDAFTLPASEYERKYSGVPAPTITPTVEVRRPTPPPQEPTTPTAPPQTPADLRAEEEARVREALGQEGIMSAYQDMISRQQELSGKLQDPREQRLDRLAALLRGGAGRSTFGMTGAGMSAGAAGERRRQNALAQELLDKEFGITREQLGAQLGIGKEALAGGREAFAQASENARAAAKRAAETLLADRQLRLDLAAGRRDAVGVAMDYLESDPVYQGYAQMLRDAQQDEDTATAETVRNAMVAMREELIADLGGNRPVAIRRK